MCKVGNQEFEGKFMPKVGFKHNLRKLKICHKSS